MIKAVIFDMDGLMFDTEALAKEAWLWVGAKLGYPITEDHIARIRGSTPAASAAVFREAFGAGFDYPRAKAMRNSMVEEVIDRQGVPIKRGLVGLLEQLDRHGLKAAVASSSPRRTVEKYLALAGVSRYFSCIVGAEDVTRSKPAPDTFLLAAERLRHCGCSIGRSLDKIVTSNGRRPHRTVPRSARLHPVDRRSAAAPGRRYTTLP